MQSEIRNDHNSDITGLNLQKYILLY